MSMEPASGLAFTASGRWIKFQRTHATPKRHMVTREDIESFLDRLTAEADGASYSEVEPGLWVVRPTQGLDLDVVVHYSPPVVIIRMKVMNVPQSEAISASLNRRLLQLNATDLVHGSYGIERDSIVLTEALELAHLDYDEFLASYEGMTLALTAHLRELAVYRGAH
jgi:hypothetical protein